MKNIEVRYRAVASLRGYARNARTHPEAQVLQIVEAIRTFGFTNPILVTPEGEVIAGHGRLEAAKRLALEQVPTIELAGLTDAERRALVLADNRIAENSGWDKAVLALELADLTGAGFGVQVLGFSDRDLGELLQPAPGAGLTHPDEAPALGVDATSAPGDVWTLGAHRVLAGDSRDSAALLRLMGGAEADLVWTDPPYNVAYRDSSILNDDLATAAFLELLRSAFAALFGVMKRGAAIYVAHSEQEGLNFRTAFAGAGFKVAACLVWRKDSLVLGRSDYQWMHEPILYGWKPGAAHRWYGGRKQTTVRELEQGSPFTKRADGAWQIALGDRTFIVEGDARVEELVPSVITEERPRKNDLHPTMKPVALIERMLRNSARPGAVVVDTFGGSGSTLIAAERLGMQARVMELAPLYVDVIVKPCEKATAWSSIMRGRKPLPANVKVLNGNPGRRPLRLDEFKPAVEIPGCPKHLQKSARAEWRRISEQLWRYGLISQVDRAALAFYCVNWARHIEAEEMIVKAAEAAGPGGSGLFVKTPNGFPVQSPWLAVSNRSMELCKTFLTEFGMTPSARSRVLPSDVQPDLFGQEGAESKPAAGFGAL